MLKKTLLIVFGFSSFILLGQEKDSLSFKNGIDKPSILATHHFGIFSSRINNNFKIAPSKQKVFSFEYTSGNNFHPFVEAYYPKDPAVREELSNTTWHDRRFNFIDQETTPADYLNIVIDAVIKEFRANLNIPLAEKHELGITLRSYLITKGKHPFSLFTGDESIEWFHSNVFGGEDPYGRRFYGLNQVNFEYNDRNGRTLKLNNNDFFIGGIELNHFYYPTLGINETRNLFFNIGSHVGINTSKFNSSVDVGVSTNAVKRIKLKGGNEFNIGLGASLLHKNMIDFKDDNIDLGTNKYLASLESDIEFTKYTRKRNYHAFSVNFHIQSRYGKLVEAGYFKLQGLWQEINGGWQHGVQTLYKALSDWTFIYTYGRPKFKLSLYFKEDFSVNNAPDFQTGVSVQIPISK